MSPANRRAWRQSRAAWKRVWNIQVMSCPDRTCHQTAPAARARARTLGLVSVNARDGKFSAAPSWGMLSPNISGGLAMGMGACGGAVRNGAPMSSSSRRYLAFLRKPSTHWSASPLRIHRWHGRAGKRRTHSRHKLGAPFGSDCKRDSLFSDETAASVPCSCHLASLRQFLTQRTGQRALSLPTAQKQPSPYGEFVAAQKMTRQVI